MRRKQLDHMQCSIAKALDVVGDPWTMLILRDALLGVNRFEQLLARLGRHHPDAMGRRVDPTRRPTHTPHRRGHRSAHRTHPPRPVRAVGNLSYGESVTQAEHGRQCAALAEEAGSGSELVVAALLHDIGHLLQAADGAMAGDRRRDRRHEAIGALWLAPRFGPGVSRPVGLHVMAKRYLCHVDESYRAQLSPASA